MNKRLKKLLRNPKKFFLGSKYLRPIVRRLRLTKDIQPRGSMGAAKEPTPLTVWKRGRFDLVGDDWQNTQSQKPFAVLWGFPRGKHRLISRYLRDYRTAFARGPRLRDAQRSVLNQHDPLTVIAWGMREPPGVSAYAEERGIPLYRMAEGFIQSASLGNWRAGALSLILDKQGIYFNASSPSDLEILLNTYDFKSDPAILEVARHCLEEIRLHGFGKHSEIATHKAPLLYGPKVKCRLLIIGQVEDSPSLPYGCNTVLTNAELIRLVAKENPRAQILYKPHPDILAGKRKEMSDLTDVSRLAEIISTPMCLKDALHEVDRVYTLTSIAGFEALIHGSAVTTVGAPFYSGWGLTEDREITGRRHRRLSLDEVFAAAYLLYPKYMDPAAKSQTTLPAVLDLLKNKLAEASPIPPDLMLERTELFSLATQTTVNSKILFNSTARSIVIISDNADALLMAKGIADKGQKVTLLFTTDALANSDPMLFALRDNHNIAISSLHKLYSIALSEIEARSVDLAKTFATDLSHVLKKVVGHHISDTVIGTLTLGLENVIYFDALRFHAARSCLGQFSSVLLLIDDVKGNLDVIKSFLYHGRLDRTLGKLFCSSIKQGTGKFIRELLEPPKLTFAETVNQDQLIAEFTTLWQDLQDPAFHEYSELGSYIAVCGNVANDNYAYAPASLKLVEVLTRETAYPVLFYSSGLLNADGQDTAKKSFLNKNLSERCWVYDGCLPRYSKKYPGSVLKRSSIFTKGIFELLLEASQRRLPYELLNIFRTRLSRYVQNLFTHTIFIAESMRAMDRCKLVATAMDRTSVSRILCAIAKDKGIPSIGIQPQIMSVSPRYWSPAVDRMGVVDSSQMDIYRKLGARPGTLEVIGSVNYLASLRKIDSCVAERGVPGDKRTVLFAMQHSNKDQMIETSLALREITERHDLQLIVKPHPRQELPVLHEVRRIFGNSKNVSVLSRESDTYAAVAQCGIVVGLNSNVLLESAVSGKPVLVAAFRDLHPSIDFSVLGVALKSLNAAALEQHLLDIIADGPLSTKLAMTRQEYMRKNPQFLRPYTHERIESFIASAFPNNVAALETSRETVSVFKPRVAETGLG